MAGLGWGNLLFMGGPQPMRRTLWHVRQQIKEPYRDIHPQGLSTLILDTEAVDLLAALTHSADLEHYVLAFRIGSVNNITLMKNVMNRQSYSYCCPPPCEKLSGLSSKWSLVRDKLVAWPTSWYEPNRLPDLCNWDAGRKLHSYQMKNYFNADRRSSCQGK